MSSLTPSHEHPDVACMKLAATSHGVITRAEAIECGQTRNSIQSRTRKGLWQRVFPEIYRIGEGRSEWHQRLSALTKWSDGVASHRAAAALHHLDGVDEEVLEITSARRMRCPDPSIIVHLAAPLPADSCRVDGIPATSPTRTLLDLASVVELDVLELTLEDALRRGLTSFARLRWCISTNGGKGRRGTRALRSLLTQYESERDVGQSTFEVRLYQLLRSANLPLPRRQFEIYEGSTFLGRPDFAYPERKLAIEAVSYRWHSGRNAWAHDQARWNRLMSAGWRVINVTWEDLTLRPEEVLRRIGEALGYPRFVT